MPFKSMHIENYKSIEKVDLNFGKLNVLIGANAAGKSNLISVFKFINNIIQFGIEDAVFSMGGIENVINYNHPHDPTTIAFEIDLSDRKSTFHKDSDNYALRVNSLSYSFSIRRNKRGNLEITDDSASLSTSIVEVISVNGKDPQESKNILGKFDYRIYLDSKKKVQSDSHIDDTIPKSIKDDIERNNLFSSINSIIQTDKKELILPYISVFTFFRREGYSKVYDFNPKVLKNYSSVSYSGVLEGDGSNLAFILKHILNDKKKKEKLITHLHDILPFIKDIRISSGDDGRISYSLNEVYSKKSCLSNYISDGTADIVALVVALLFAQTTCLIFEEPENNIHPQLLARLMSHMKSTTEKTQIILTSHSPELINYVSIDSLLFVKREEGGQSVIVKPSDSPTVQEFIKNELNPGQLFIDGLLGD